MGAEHTPGPWVAASAYGLLKTEVLAVNEGRVVATVWTKTMAAEPGTGRSIAVDRPDGIANLALIAAAPDLLAALKNAIETHHSGSGRWLQTAYDAIAKAEGTPTPNSTTLLSAVSAKDE